MTFGLLLLRVALGALLAGHGTQKLLGWWGGHGPEGTGRFMHSLGHRPGPQMAVIAGASETAAGLLLALGFLYPLGTAIAVGVMLVAASAHVSYGLWNESGGFELPLFFAVTAAALGFTGPGSASLDGAIGWDGSVAYATAAVLIGISGAIIVMTRARRLIEDEQVRETPAEELVPELQRRAA